MVWCLKTREAYERIVHGIMEDERMIDNRELFEKLAKSLIGYFGRIYLVNMKTNEYHRYYMDDNSCLLIIAAMVFD